MQSTEIKPMVIISLVLCFSHTVSVLIYSSLTVSKPNLELILVFDIWTGFTRHRTEIAGV